MSTGLTLSCNNHQTMNYPILEMDYAKGILLLEDPDTGKEFNFCPYMDEDECKKVFFRLGYSIIEAPDADT